MLELRRQPRQSASASRIGMRGRCSSGRNRKALVNGIAYRPELAFRQDVDGGEHLGGGDRRVDLDGSGE